MCMHHIIEKSSVLETLSKGVTHEVHRSQKVFFAPITPASPYWCLLLIGNWRLCWDDVRRFGCSFRSLCRKRPIHLPPTKLARLLNNIYIAKEYKLSKRLPKSAPSSITSTSLCSNTEWADAVLILKRYSHGCSQSKMATKISRCFTFFHGRTQGCNVFLFSVSTPVRNAVAHRPANHHRNI